MARCDYVGEGGVRCRSVEKASSLKLLNVNDDYLAIGGDQYRQLIASEGSHQPAAR
jgi:hypothetical protein